MKLIKEVQPYGPYHLAGASFGGLLAYEIAKQLIATDEKIATLTMLDTILTSAASIDWKGRVAHTVDFLQSQGVHKFAKKLNQKFIGTSKKRKKRQEIELDADGELR